MIDRSEARELFKAVDKPNEAESTICEFLRSATFVRATSSGSAIVLPFTEIFDSPPKDSDDHAPHPPAVSETADVSDQEHEQRPAEHDDGSAEHHDQE